MRIRLRKLDEQRHELEIVRDDGSSERRTLETRSFLVHDLSHYAIEAEAGMVDGVFGQLASGVSFDGLAFSSPGLARAETLSGPFQSLWHGRMSREAYVSAAKVDEAFVDAALERMRRLMGHWKATRFGQVMEILWPPR